MKQLLDIKPSTLDKQAPAGVQIMYRLVERVQRRGPPRIIADYTSAEDAQQASNRLAGQGREHSFLTWWRSREGKHVHKWATILEGKRRFFRVSVPYVPGVNDDNVKEWIRHGLLHEGSRPAEYEQRNAVSVRADPNANRMEADSRWVQVRVSAECADKFRALPPSEAAQLVEQAIMRMQ